MTNVTQRSKHQNLCSCHVELKKAQKKIDFYKRKRQVFVYNPDEEILYEPYMRTLHQEFSDESVVCDSKIELPWREIALPTGMRVRPDVTLTADREALVDEAKTKPVEERRDSTEIALPWKDLLITETLQSTLEDRETCGSSVEIPWGDLTLERPMVIGPPREDETCALEGVEIPWSEIMVPQNIVIEPKKRRKHPSSEQPPRTSADVTCIPCDARHAFELTFTETSLEPSDGITISKKTYSTLNSTLLNSRRSPLNITAKDIF